MFDSTIGIIQPIIQACYQTRQYDISKDKQQTKFNY